MAYLRNCYLMLLVVVLTKAQYRGQSYEEPRQQPQQYQPQQYQEPVQYAGTEPRRPLPAIIMHKQALTQEGAFNFAFAADNGLQQGETINPDGSRTGSYSYVDPAGKTIKVKYSAGKEGFRVLEGDHVPRAPQPTQQEGASVAGPGPYNSPQATGPHYSAQPQYRAGPSIPEAFRANDRYQVPNPGASIFNGPNPQAKPRPIYQVNENHEPTLFRASAPYQSYQPKSKPTPQDDGEYNEESKNEPHSFGGGYSFEFSG